VQNIQNTLFEKLCYETQVAKWGPSNFYTFARSAVDRARALTGIWNGDSRASFQGLAYSVASGIRAGLLGFSMWGADCGGYVRSPTSPTDELWARWMHHSTWSPVYELMLGTGHTPWYPPYTSRLVGILKTTANRHAALLPYIRSYTYAATQTGIPLIRSLFLEFPSDTAVYSIADAYSFGSEFLVAPIVNAGGSRSVYFPKGAKWLEYFNKTDVHAGGTTQLVSLDWEDVPVYVREGSIVPVGDVYQGNAKWIQDWKPFLDIEVFPSYGVPKTSFQYYNPAASGGGTEERGEGTIKGRLATVKRRNHGVVDINVVTDSSRQKVLVTYGDLGTQGMLRVYGKDEVHTFALVSGGGNVTLTGFASLFA
jgi:alpha-D-xyloside xylohydrolase